MEMRNCRLALRLSFIAEAQRVIVLRALGFARCAGLSIKLWPRAAQPDLGMKTVSRSNRNQNKTYRSIISAAVHEAMSDLHDIGLIDKKTMRSFDAACLTEVEPMTAKDVAALGARQPMLAHHLNVAVKLVGEWERSEKRPRGPSLKLLTLVKAKGLDAID